jgi:AcrR family transcriptional regulator
MAPDKKNEILAAAGQCFARYGYDKTTMDDIGELVGMNKVSLYYYFKNKETLFKEMILQDADQYSAMIKEKVANISGSSKRILAWIETGFQFNQSGSILHQLSMETLKKLSPQLEELKEYAMKIGSEYIASILAEGVEKKEIIPCDVKHVAESIHRVIYSMKDSAYQRSRNEPGQAIDFRALAKEILFTVGLMLDGIKVK